MWSSCDAGSRCQRMRCSSAWATRSRRPRAAWPARYRFREFVLDELSIHCREKAPGDLYSLARRQLSQDPQSKGIVKHLCGYAQRDLVVPLMTEAKISGVAVSVPVANAAAAAWCAEVSAAVYSEIAAVPEERPDAERDLLAPLPSPRPEIGAVTRKVDRLSCNRYGSARYSVPTRLVGGHREHRHRSRCAAGHRADTAAMVGEHELVAPGLSRYWMLTTTGLYPHLAAGHAPKPRQSNNSAPWVKTPKRFWSARRQSVTPAWARRCRSAGVGRRPPRHRVAPTSR